MEHKSLELQLQLLNMSLGYFRMYPELYTNVNVFYIQLQQGSFTSTTQDALILDFNNSQAKPNCHCSCTTPCQFCIRVTTISTCKTAANKVRQEMI